MLMSSLLISIINPFTHGHQSFFFSLFKIYFLIVVQVQLSPFPAATAPTPAIPTSHLQLLMDANVSYS